MRSEIKQNISPTKNANPSPLFSYMGGVNQPLATYPRLPNVEEIAYDVASSFPLNHFVIIAV